MPPFIIYVAADLYNQKVNLELTFPSHPTMGELNHHVQAVFAAECAVTRPPSSPKQQQFGISRVQLYSDDGTGQWRDLSSSSMLQPYAQIYVFQSDPNFRESQDQIPPARRPACYTSNVVAGSTARATPARSTSSTYHGNSASNNGGADQQQFGGSAALYEGAAMSGAQQYNTNATNSNAAAAAMHNGINNSRVVANNNNAINASVSGSSYYAASQSQQRNNTNSAGGNDAALSALNATNTSMQQQQQRANNNSSASASLFYASAASHSDKVHIIFEAACKNGARYLQEGDVRALFRDTNIDFAPYVIAALFRQADADRDGVLTAAELQLLLKEYPTLTDALFFRLKDLQEGELLQQRLAEECVQLEEARRRKDHTAAADAENARRIEEQSAKMKGLEAQWQTRLAMENDMTERLAAERNEMAAIKEAAANHNKDLTVMVGRDDAARRYLADAEREASYCEQQHSKAVHQAQVADHRVKELLELLEAAKMEAAQQHRNVDECATEVKRSKDNEKKAADQLAEFSADLQRRKQYSEKLSDELLMHQTKQKELSHLLNECQLENEKLAQTIEHNSEDLRRLEHGRDLCRRDVTLAEAAIADCDRRIAAADHGIVVFAQRRAATEAKEKPLLEQEIRLKEQRLQLDENETMLRREAYNVFDPLARGNFPSANV